MNKEQTVLLSLIKQSQFGPSETISFADVDMDGLYKEAEQQSVIGLVSSEIPDEYTNPKWYKAFYRRKASYFLYCDEQDELKKEQLYLLEMEDLKPNAVVFSMRV